MYNLVRYESEFFVATDKELDDYELTILSIKDEINGFKNGMKYYQTMSKSIITEEEYRFFSKFFGRGICGEIYWEVLEYVNNDETDEDEEWFEDEEYEKGEAELVEPVREGRIVPPPQAIRSSMPEHRSVTINEYEVDGLLAEKLGLNENNISSFVKGIDRLDRKEMMSSLPPDTNVPTQRNNNPEPFHWAVKIDYDRMFRLIDEQPTPKESVFDRLKGNYTWDSQLINGLGGDTVDEQIPN